MASAREIYDQNVRPLPTGERLRLAAMILNDINESLSGIDVSDEWSEEDLRDLTAYSLRIASAFRISRLPAYHAASHDSGIPPKSVRT